MQILAEVIGDLAASILGLTAAPFYSQTFGVLAVVQVRQIFAELIGVLAASFLGRTSPTCRAASSWWAILPLEKQGPLLAGRP